MNKNEDNSQSIDASSKHIKKKKVVPAYRNHLLYKETEVDNGVFYALCAA